MFVRWGGSYLPRLWHLDQRQAIRIDAESLFGSSQFAAVYSKTGFTTLPAMNETMTKAIIRGRTSTTVMPGMTQTTARTLTLSRTQTTATTMSNSGRWVRNRSGIVKQIVDDIN